MAEKRKTHVSMYLCRVLRHHPEDLGLHMDHKGWVLVDELIEQMNALGPWRLSREALGVIVQTDPKGRYCFSDDGLRIKACQGHSLPWVEPELEVLPPPHFLYHGTNSEALEAIMESGAILRMQRHAVHLQAEAGKAWQSARRWRGKTPVVLKIDAARLAHAGTVFGKSENDVWCCETVPIEFITKILREQTR